jgi:hypothetical protein
MFPDAQTRSWDALFRAKKKILGVELSLAKKKLRLGVIWGKKRRKGKKLAND